ncbi:MAG: hypothetical protein FWC77_07600 [Defluviitaleaceae bacterium]|nr:hypothetical protein [Defluviitaleaceae bacterium]
MGFWTAIVIIAAIAIGTEFVLRVVKMGTRYSENVERIKRGYPTLDGAMPMGGAHDTMPDAGDYVHGDRLQ